MNSIRKILEAVAKEHPYRIPGIRESYDTYAEGWTDAVNEIESRLPDVPGINVGDNSEIPNGSTLQPTCNQLATDTISRQAAIDLYEQFQPYIAVKAVDFGKALEQLPSVTQELLYRGAISLDKQEILQAGYEGREYDFYIGGRLFSIREKAQ